MDKKEILITETINFLNTQKKIDMLELKKLRRLLFNKCKLNPEQYLHFLGHLLILNDGYAFEFKTENLYDELDSLRYVDIDKVYKLTKEDLKPPENLDE